MAEHDDTAAMVRRVAILALVSAVVACFFDPSVMSAFALILGVTAGWGFGILHQYGYERKT